MNPLQMALKKFGRRYSGAGREGFSLSRPTEASYGGTEVIKDPTIGVGRAANRAMNPQELFRQREDAVAGNPLGGVGEMLTKVFGGKAGDLGAFGDDKYTDNGMIAEVQTDKTIPLGTEVFTRGIEQLPTQEIKVNSGSARRPSVADKLKDEIVRRESKDFSKRRNPETGEVEYGADYDRDHNWKDALRAAGLSALQALASGDPNASIGQQLGRGLGGALGGGISGAFDPNADEKIGNEMVLNRDYPKWARAFQRESQETNQKLGEEYKQEQIRTIGEDDRRQAANLKRQEERDAAQSKRWEAMADRDRLKLLGDEELRQMRDKWALAKDANEKRRLAAVEKEMENRMTRADADRASREKIAGMNEAGRTARSAASLAETIRSNARKEGLDARNLRAKLKADGATPEEIEEILNGY